MSAVGVRAIEQVDDRTLAITWSDGQEQRLDVVELRRTCPCAVCVDEVSGRRVLRPDDVPEDVRPVEIRSVGRYALAIAFDDGHDTGIYAFDRLRAMT